MHIHRWIIGLAVVTWLVQPSWAGLIGHWRLDDATGTSASDRGPSAITGTLCDSTCPPTTAGPTWNTTGRWLGSLSFDGTDDYVDLTDIAATDGASTLSVSIWVKATNLTTNFRSAISKRNADASRWYMSTAGTVAGNDDVLIGVSNGLNSFGHTTGNIFSAGVWAHWAFVFDGAGAANADRLKFYFNGVAQTLTFGANAIPATTHTNAIPVMVGRLNVDYWLGDLDDVRIFSHALSPGEITRLYVRGRIAR